MLIWLKYKFYNLLSSKSFRSFCLFALILTLSGCGENDEENSTTAGAEGNYNAQSMCWQTQITHTVTAAIDILYNGSIAQAVGSGANVILVAFAVWMAFKLLKVLASFKEENLGEIWTEIFQKAVLCAGCAYFLSGSGAVTEALNLSAIPIYNSLLDLGLNILGNDGGGSISLGSYGAISFSHEYSACPHNSVAAGSIKSAIQPVSDCMICRISERLNAGLKIGIVLISTGKIGPIFVGILMLILFTCAKFGFVLFVIDSLFRMNFAVTLLPLLIAGIPFSPTRKWSKQGLLMFINSSGIMLFLGLLISVTVGALEGILRDVGPQLSENADANLATPMLSMALISLLLISIPGLAVVMADKFIGGGAGLEFQQRVSKFIINSVKRAGYSLLSTISHGATTPVSEAMDKYEKIRAATDKIKQASTKAASAMKRAAGKEDD